MLGPKTSIPKKKIIKMFSAKIVKKNCILIAHLMSRNTRPCDSNLGRKCKRIDRMWVLLPSIMMDNIAWQQISM